MPPNAEKTNINKYIIHVFDSICPLEKTSNPTVINNAKNIAETRPETNPFSLHLNVDKKPLEKAPAIIMTIKYQDRLSGNFCDLLITKEKKTDNKKVISTPTTDDIVIPIIFSIISGYSFLLVSFLRIKKSLTFNKEYEGFKYFMLNYSSSFLDFLPFFSAIAALAASRSA